MCVGGGEGGGRARAATKEGGGVRSRERLGRKRGAADDGARAEGRGKRKEKGGKIGGVFGLRTGL